MSGKKLSALILALLMLASSLASCSDKGDNIGDETDPAVQNESSSESESAVEEDTGTHYYDAIEAVDYEGWKFGIASRPLSSTYWNNICVEEQTGDSFIDALYNREIALEDKFNIKIEENYYDGDSAVTGAVSKSVSAGLNEHALGYRCYLGAFSMFTSGICMPISDVPVVDLTKPYWDQGAQEDLTINGKMYYAIGDIGFDQYESSLMLYFNGLLLENYQIEKSPHELFLEGKWTLDNMNDMMETVSSDVDGNGTMEPLTGDIFGFVGRDSDYLPVLLSTGIELIEYDDNTQEIKYNLIDERVIEIGEKCKAVFLRDNIVPNDSYDYSGRDVFKRGETLFFGSLLGEFRLLRDNEDDYGVLVWPSDEENKAEKVYTENPTTLLIAADTKDEERLGTILESLAAYTYDYVIEDYVNKAVVGKGARDQQSAQIIRDTLGRRYYDPADAWDISTANDAWENAVNKGTYSSVFAKAEKMVKLGLNNILNKLD